MDIRQARYFAAACHGGSLSAAARKLGVSVQAASKAIGELEAQVAEPLFVRNDRGVVPTAAGLGLLARVEPFLEAFDSLNEFVQDPDGCAAPCDESAVDARPMTLKLALCSPPLAGIMDMRAHFEQSISRALGVRVSLAVASVPEGLSMLRAGKLDCLFSIGRIAGDDLRCVPYGSLKAGVLLSSAHPLAGFASVTLDDLAPYRAVNSLLYDHCGGSIFDVYMEQGLRSVPYVSTSMDDYKRVMLEGDAYVFSAYLPVLHQHSDVLAIRPIADVDSVPIPQCLVTLASSRSAACRALEHIALTKPAALMS